ncbi:hypothetical protein IAU60_005660 [Kwoniella sp. DSM 27419]
MAGPNLEIVKFGFYMFFPIYVMFKFGDPEWYTEYVAPYKQVLWPEYETTYQPPKTSEGLKEELARMKAERLAKAQLKNSSLSSSTSAPTSHQTTSDGPTQGTASVASQIPPQPAAADGSGTKWGWPRSGGGGTRLV